MSEYEELLIELIFYLAHGTREEMGFDLKEIKHFLKSPIKKYNETPLERLAKEGRSFINELKTFMNEVGRL